MAQENLIGKTKLGYKIEEESGSGTFGRVYKVEKTDVSGKYIRALKHITIPQDRQQYNAVLNSMGGDISKVNNYFSKMQEEIANEIRILNKFSEQHIIRYYDHQIDKTNDKADPRHIQYDVYILMEYLMPINEYIQQHELLVRDVIKLGLDVLRGLKVCHNKGIIHRDIKDDNIFISEEGEYKIGDFGVSKILKGSARAESLKGTPDFLAPEVYLGKESYTKSVDLYSLGIVLYRLLNYSRNPFLPHFPKEYEIADQDNAFMRRMNGEIPDLPSLGGEKIGNVIVKALRNHLERFQTADEFYDALEKAIFQTEEDTLNQKINFISVENNTYKNKSEKGEKEEYGETLGEKNSDFLGGTAKNFEKEEDGGINKGLFDEPVEDEEVIKVPSVEENKEKDKGKREEKKPDVPLDPPKIEEIKEPAAIDKKIVSKVVFIIPVFIVLIGIAAYLIVVPKMYGEMVSFVDWLFTSPENIISTLREPDAVFSKANSIVGIKIFWYVWLASFITSLFFVGKQLHTIPEPDNINAILTKEEPYLMIQEIEDILKQAKERADCQEIVLLLKSVRQLREKLSVESDFGYGNDSIIQCENNIAKQLQFLLNAVPHIDSGDIHENISNINTAINNINSQLKKRTMLKRK